MEHWDYGRRWECVSLATVDGYMGRFLYGYDNVEGSNEILGFLCWRTCWRIRNRRSPEKTRIEIDVRGVVQSNGMIQAQLDWLDQVGSSSRSWHLGRLNFGIYVTCKKCWILMGKWSMKDLGMQLEESIQSWILKNIWEGKDIFSLQK